MDQAITKTARFGALKEQMRHLSGKVLGNPSLLFAFSAALFWGHEGGVKLALSLAIMGAIAFCILLRETTYRTTALGALLARPATAQVLVGVLGIATAAVIFAEKPISEFLFRDYVFLCCAAGALYNSPLTVLGLPIMIAGVIISVRGSLSLGRINLQGVGMPYYLNVAYNFWYAGCNLLSDHPSSLVVASCAVGGIACYSLGVTADKMAAANRIPADQLVYIEIPGVVYKAPRLADDFANTWSPVSFELATR